ncbi:MAG: hypothetical protein D6689_16390 [Deltaproteobacteria bacterium]|nr:MAG: hypothetical protein D6689_16390 [Deltaproteobacteria bacterium]
MARPPKQRRALSTVRSDAPIATEGEPAVAAALAAALRIGPREDAVAGEYTHGFHAYPARMHPATARRLVALARELAPSPGPARVLDPFCGSGTVLVEARAAGASARGVDANPLAVLIARAKTSVGRPEFRRAVRDRADVIAAAVIEAGRRARRSGEVPAARRTPRGADPAQRQRQLARWFAPHVRRELEALAAAVDAEPANLRVPLAAALSAILYKASRRESDTVPAEVERLIARGAPSRWFRDRAHVLADGLDALAVASAPRVAVARGDARALARAAVAADSIDAIVTSPPYPGVYDYLAHQELRYAFLGLGSGQFARVELGSRRSFRGDAAARRRALAAWRKGYAAALAQMARALRPGGIAALVVGDSVAGGEALFADRELAVAAPADLAFVASASQQRPALSAAERRAFGDRPKCEYILLYRKL